MIKIGDIYYNKDKNRLIEVFDINSSDQVSYQEFKVNTKSIKLVEDPENASKEDFLIIVKDDIKLFNFLDVSLRAITTLNNVK